MSEISFFSEEIFPTIPSLSSAAIIIILPPSESSISLPNACSKTSPKRELKLSYPTILISTSIFLSIKFNMPLIACLKLSSTLVISSCSFSLSAYTGIAILIFGGIFSLT